MQRVSDERLQGLFDRSHTRAVMHHCEKCGEAEARINIGGDLFRDIVEDLRDARAEVARLREALEKTQWGFMLRRCPVCSGWNMSDNGETDFAHTPECIVGIALKGQP